MKKFVFVFLLLVTGVASAGNAVLTWTAPTKRCDGTSLTNLSGYVLKYGQARSVLATAPLTYTVTNLTPGEWWFSIQTTTSTPGDMSDALTVSKTITEAEFVVASQDVFTVVKRVDRFIMTKVGTVPLGTQCIPTQRVNEMYVVPIAKVTWSGTVKADVVVAQCK